MKRFVPPTCDSCKSERLTMFYDEQLGVRFCYFCLKDAADFMARHGLLESNPLCEILFDGVWHTTDSTYEVWYQSQYDSRANGNLWITRLDS